MGEKTNHDELKEIFSQALELDGIEREKFLNEACRENPELRLRVESLLKSLAKNNDLFEKPVIQFSPIHPEKSQQILLPSVPGAQLKGDLDNIILMALRKEPSRRYASAEDLSKDISNYLIGLPVTARPNTFQYRATKFFQRNKTASIVGVFLVLTLILGIIATTWQAVVANRQRDRAEKRFQDVRQLSNSLLFEVTPNIENLTGSTKAREILVKRALEYLDSLANESSNDLQLRLELASAYEKVGELQASSEKPSLNDLSGAIESYQKAQSIRQNLPPSLENQRGLAENHRGYSDLLFAKNDVKGSLKISAEAIELYQKLIAENPQNFDLQISLIQTKLDYGATFSSNNQYAEATPIFQNAVTELARLEQNNKDVQRLTLLALAQLGNALSWSDKQPEAETEMAKAVKIADEMVAQYPNDTVIRRNSFRVYTLASGIYEEIKNDLALEFAEKALQVATRGVETDSSDLLAKAFLGQAFSRMGICLVNVNQVPKALTNLQRAEKLFQELAIQDPRNHAYQRNLGVLYLRIGDAQTLQKNYSEALKNYQNSADLLGNLAQMDEKNTLARRDEAQSLKNVGQMQLKLNRKAEAKRTFQKVLQILTDLKLQNALGEIDEKIIDEMQNALKN